MTHPQTAALTALLEQVETGRWWGDLLRPAVLHTDLCWKAFNGDLNAAKLLHEAVLPNHAWDIWRDIGADCVRYYGCNLPGVDTAFAADPARAWLIAIIRALIAAADTEDCQ